MAPTKKQKQTPTMIELLDDLVCRVNVLESVEQEILAGLVRTERRFQQLVAVVRALHQEIHPEPLIVPRKKKR